jgi:hypothetical protein
MLHSTMRSGGRDGDKSIPKTRALQNYGVILDLYFYVKATRHKIQNLRFS